MAKVNHTPRVVVLGMGNILLKDEGIGVHVAHALEEAPFPDNVELEVLDGGTLPDATMSVGEVDKLVVVDAVQGGDKPGAIYRFRPEDISVDNTMPVSLHQIGLLENLWLMDKFSQKPREVVIIGIEPEDMSWGLELSAELQQRIPQIVEVVLAEVASEYPDDSEKGDLRK
jgi:hydrogenase maturation protease